jgi:hypothetical protein
MSIGSELSIRMLTVAVLLLLQDETQAVKAAHPMGDGTIEGSFESVSAPPYWTSLELTATSTRSRRYLLSLPFDEVVRAGFVSPRPDSNGRPGR